MHQSLLLIRLSATPGARADSVVERRLVRMLQGQTGSGEAEWWVCVPWPQPTLSDTLVVSYYCWINYYMPFNIYTINNCYAALLLTIIITIILRKEFY